MGIPAESKGAERISDAVVVDTRSPEFKAILNKLYQCQISLKQYNNFKDYDKYQKWLDQLLTRATSLVAKAMRELLENAAKACSDYNLKLAHSASNGAATKVGE